MTSKPSANPPIFFSRWHVGLFFIISSLILIELFPKQSISENLFKHNSDELLALEYVESLSRSYPKNVALQLELLQIYAQLNKKALFEAHEASLNIYELNRAQLVQLQYLSYLLKRHDIQSTNGNWSNVAAELLQLAHYNTLTPMQMVIIAQDIHHIDKNESNRLLEHLQHQNIRNVSFIKHLAKLNHQLGHHQQAGQLYTQLMLNTHDYLTRKHYFIKVSTALVEGDLSREALAFAQKHAFPFFEKDKDILLELTRLAHLTNQPNLAEQYILKALKLP